MSELTTKRTLVKSPPELWAEVSDLEALAKHLGEFGEIRITRLDPETTVVWEGDRISGTVQLEPSGWGTKVTLTAELAEVEAATPEPAAPLEDSEAEEAPLPLPIQEAIEPEQAAEPFEPRVEDPVIEAEVVEEQVAEEEPVAQEPPPPSPIQETPEPEPELSAAPEPKLGFWARLFGRRKAEVPPQPQPPPPTPTPFEEPAPVEEPPTPEPPPLQPVPEPEPPPREPEPEDPLPAAELDDDKAVAVLTEVLDNLGAAHHRPFSRG